MSVDVCGGGHCSQDTHSRLHGLLKGNPSVKAGGIR